MARVYDYLIKLCFNQKLFDLVPGNLVVVSRLIGRSFDLRAANVNHFLDELGELSLFRGLLDGGTIKSDEHVDIGPVFLEGLVEQFSLPDRSCFCSASQESKSTCSSESSSAPPRLAVARRGGWRVRGRSASLSAASMRSLSTSAASASRRRSCKLSARNRRARTSVAVPTGPSRMICRSSRSAHSTRPRSTSRSTTAACSCGLSPLSFRAFSAVFSASSPVALRKPRFAQRVHQRRIELEAAAKRVAASSMRSKPFVH